METDYVKHLKGLSKAEREDEIACKLKDKGEDLMNTEIVSGEIASSNATDWRLNDCEILDVGFGHPMQAHVKFAYELKGEQDDDKTFSGTKIKGEALAVVDGAGEIDFTNVTAERDLD